jgi:hypothetical protein
MKPTSETRAILKALSVHDNWFHIGQELASTMNAAQAENFRQLVIGHNTIKIILRGK